MVLSADLRHAVQAKLKDAADGDRLVKAVDDIMSMLRTEGHVCTQRLPPQQVGVHPCNRDGLGLSSADVHSLLDEIIDVGFVASRVHAVAVEIADDSVRKWNEELVHASAKLGALQGDKLKAVSLSASHTNFALRLLAQEVEHESDLVSVQGKLSMARLQQRDRAFYEAALHGLEWSVISKDVAEAFPELLHYVQTQGNATLSRGEHELQVVRRLHTLWLQADATGNVDFGVIKKRTLASKPGCAKSVPHLYTFALKCAGGRSAVFLQETENFVRAHAPSSRMLGPDIWEILSQDARGPAQNVLFRHALVKLAYIRDTLTAQEARKAFTKAVWGKASEADVIMQEWRRIVREQCDLQKDHRIVAAMGYADVALAAMVLNVKVHGERKYETMQGMAHGFVTMLRTIAGNAAIRSPWEEFEEACPPSSSASQPLKDKHIMRELNTDGSVKPHEDRLLEAGFEMGQSVRRKPDMLEGKLVGLKDGKVRVELIENGLVAKILIDDFLSGAWHKFTPRAQPQLIENPAKYHPSHFPEWLAFNMKARITSEIAEAVCRYGADHWDKLNIQVKPSKLVLCKSAIPKHKLMLAPASLNLRHKFTPPEGPPPFMVETAFPGECYFWIAPTVVQPKAEDDGGFLNPFWFVGTSHEEADCNMEVVYKSVNKDSGIKLPMLRNKEALSEGDRLVLFKDRAAAPEPAALEMTPPKRRGTASEELGQSLRSGSG
ncbi:unnamed protein product [Effrenium voratum]|uniref:Uncharacterized protein n=1 Tax=Effrenium voratum TaxID=2562239 RepID=A0AA36IY15_9DINO|nr:unnamed protein product [Effrenium voratum]CAJ1416039.1 unnamed protein product [Effrenium voratum]